jgi:hypothetical protein
VSDTISNVHIRNRPVILSEAYFSGVEGPAFWDPIDQSHEEIIFETLPQFAV